MTDERKPKVIVELREHFHQLEQPTEEEAAAMWKRIEDAQDREEKPRWHIEHAGAPAVRPARLSIGDLALWVVAIGFVLFAIFGGQL